MKLVILSPSEVVAKMDVDSVTMPSVEGQMTALQGHDTLLALLDAGTVRCSRSGARGHPEVHEFEIGTGLVEVIHDMVTVCASSASRSAAVQEEKGGGNVEGRTL